MFALVLRAGHKGRFLNRGHSWIVRLLFGLTGFFFVLLSTGERVLAREMFHRFYAQDGFLAALRRCSWYARRSWLGLTLSNDCVYVFCYDLSVDELVAMRRFLLRRNRATPDVLYFGDLAYIDALTVMGCVGLPEYQPMLARFEGTMRSFVSHVSKGDSPPVAEPVIKTRELFAADAARNALQDIMTVLRGAGMRPFILSGTLLGLVRENGFLPHDYDIDVGVMAAEYDAETILTALNKNGRFKINADEAQISFERNTNGTLSVVSRPVMLKLGHVDGVQVDIFVHHLDNQNRLWHGSSLFRWDNSPFDLVDYELDGVRVLGPVDADRYLTENYGNWRVPVVDFHSAIHTTNQQVVRNPLSAAIFVRRYWLALGSDARVARAIMTNLIDSGMFRETEDGLDFDPSIFAV